MKTTDGLVRFTSWLALAPMLAMLSSQPAAAQEACALTPIGTGIVASVRDGRTLLLSDGREVRLAGIEPGPGGREALQRLADGASLRLKIFVGNSDPEAPHDRYGRLVAFVLADEAPASLQLALLEAGQARVSGRIGNKACAEALLAAERAARLAGRGLWADPNFAPLSSENLAGLKAARGHFALVEGRVLSVRESGATLYVNFGRRWTRDFTVTIPKRQRRTFAAAGIDPDRLEGSRIRVRGYLEQRGGPIIEAAVPEQIEPMD